ncbi:hypothetical protein V1264_000349 [Littorina saxatilis]|uniref:Uncharacterized protein n=1 Tax=Littorina saxatilis TaxID=31220 RepID=A0AAN9C008_9CAEN
MEMKRLVPCVILLSSIGLMSGQGGTSDCPDPSPVANSFRTFHTTPQGVTVTYTCVDGHVHTGAGSLERHCYVTSGGGSEFTEDPPVCTLNCSTPRPLAEANHNGSNHGDYLAGSVVGYTCSKGYNIPKNLDNTMRCLPDTGQWEGDHNKLMCRAELNLVNASVHQSPPGPRPAYLGVDGNNSTCSSTANDTKPEWAVSLSDNLTDVITITVTLRLSDPGLSMTLRVEAKGGEVETCGKLNMTKATYYDNQTLSGKVHCYNYLTNSKPYGLNLSLSATFEDSQAAEAASSLEICDLTVKAVPHTASCNWPPRIPRLRLVTDGWTAFSMRDVVRYVCEDSFTPLSGYGNSSCGFDSGWSPPSLVCTDAEDRVQERTTTYSNNTTVEVMLRLTGSCEVFGVYINSTAYVNVTMRLRQGATSEKTCDVRSDSDTGMFISCHYRPVASHVLLYMSNQHYQHVHVDHIKVFGTPYTTGLECLQSDTGPEYKGKLNVTERGYSCQRWADNSPGRYTTADDFPDYTLEDAGNFCRNPADSETAPWCFVDGVTGVTKDNCDIFHCDQFCKVRPDGTGYKGSQNVVKSGTQNCKNWLAWAEDYGQPFMRSLEFPDMKMDHRFCRNPAGSQSVPWCFVNKNLDNEHCDIPFCPRSVSTVFILQSNVSTMGAAYENSSVIKECHAGGEVWHLAAKTLAELVNKACQGWTEDLNLTALCRSTPRPDPTNDVTIWTRFVVYCGQCHNH